MPKSPDDIFKIKVDHLLASEIRFNISIANLESKIYFELVSKYLPLFELENGLIINSRANDLLIAKIDRFFKKLEKSLYRDVLGGLARDILRSSTLSSDYFIALGYKKSVVSSLLKDRVRLEHRLGITPSGRLAKGGYLYQLGQTKSARQKLKNYVLTNILGGTKFLDFQLGFRNLVIGNKRVKGLSVNGHLKQYFSTYTHDIFSQVDALANNEMAAALGLSYFIYEGSLIKTSRRFCEKRAGKVFSVKETKDWKNDPDLIDKKNKSSYNPLIERGRYNCRHFIKYISKELYDELK